MSQNPNLSFWNLLQSISTNYFLLMLSSFQKAWHFTLVDLSFCSQDPTSHHYISKSTNFSSPCNKVEQKQSLYLGIKSTQHQISPSSDYPNSSPRNTFDHPPTTDIPKYQSIIPISISMVNNPPKMYKFLSPTFARIQSRMHKFLSLTEYVFNKSGDHTSISRKVQCQITITDSQGLMLGHYPTSR